MPFIIICTLKKSRSHIYYYCYKHSTNLLCALFLLCSKPTFALAIKKLHLILQLKKNIAA